MLPLPGVGSEAFEQSGLRFIAEQLTSLKIEIPAMQSEHPLFDPIPNPGKGHQVVEGQPDRFLFASPDERPSIRYFSGTGAYIACHLHPARNERTRTLHTFDHRPDAPTLGMSENDQFRNFEITDSKLKGCTRAMVETAGLTRGYQIGDVTDHEKVSRPAIGQNCRVYTGIATANNKGQRRLSHLRKTLIEGAVRDKISVTKSMIAGDEFYNT